MASRYKDIAARWARLRGRYYWGDPLDVRFYLCEAVSELRNKKILDMGCNVGVVTGCLDASNEVEAVDVNEDALRMAKEINLSSVTFSVHDMFDLPYAKGSFDAVILANVLPQHDFLSRHTPEELVAHAYSFLKPGGTLFLTTPNAANPYYRNRGKFVDGPYLRELFPPETWSVSRQGWNPFPIQAGHVLKYMPGIMNFLEWVSKKGVSQKKCVAWYVRAVKKGV